MSILRKSNTYVGLNLIDVLIDDANPTSTFFRIFEVPETFPGGKTAFRINGSSFLKPNSEVKVEVLNAEGNVIYSEYPKYLEGSSRLISVYVYPDELYGAATITIVGEAQIYPGTRETSRFLRIPTEWQGISNIRWQKQILVDPALRNDSKIRFYTTPVIDAQEVYAPYLERTYTTSSNPEYVDYSVGKIAGNTLGDYSLIMSDGGEFNRLMVGGILTVTTPAPYVQSYTTKIKTVFNETVAVASIPYQVTGNLTPEYEAISRIEKFDDTIFKIPTTTTYQNFNPSDYTIRYVTEPTYSETENYRSFAKVHINDMSTFSGDVYSTKLFMKYVGSGKDYEPIGDVVLESRELMLDDQFTNIDTRYGYLYGQDTIDTYWTSSRQGTHEPVALLHTSQTILDAMYITGSSVARAYKDYDVIYPNSQSLDFAYNTEYLFEASFYARQTSKISITGTTLSQATLYIFASGSAFNDTANLSPKFNGRGKLVQQIELGRDESLIGEIDQGFFPDRTGTGQLQFVVDSGDWYVSNIGLSAAQETGFSPGSTIFLIPINDWQRDQSALFKAEFYNQMGDRADVFATSSEEYFRGSNFFIAGDDNLLTGSLYISNVLNKGIEISGVQSAYLRNVGYEGYYSASDGSGPGGFMIWSGSVLTDTNTLSGTPRYDAVGIELHGGSGSSPDGGTHALRFRTDTGKLEITGSIWATDGNFSGYISASEGNIGGWSILPNMLQSSDGGMQLYGDGTISSSNFNVNSEGDLTGSNVLFTGGTITGGVTILGSLSANSILTPAEIGGSPATYLNASSSISDLGYAIFRSASIGGWKINENQIYSTNLIMDSDGTLQTSNFASGLTGWRITGDFNGYAEFENARIRGTLSTTVFEKETVNAVGGQLWIANSTIISGSTISATPGEATYATWSVENASSWARGEVVKIKKVTDTGFSTEYVSIDSSSRIDPASGVDFRGNLYVTRSWNTDDNWYFGQLADPSGDSIVGDSGSGAYTYELGQVIVSTGVSQSGYIRLNANPRDPYTPYMDIVERTGSGVYDLDLKVRLGDLSGLSPALLYGDTKPGFGLYTENVYLTGKITATTGSFIGKVHAGGYIIGSSVPASSQTSLTAASGTYINDYNYWYDNGLFGVGDSTNYITWDGSSLAIVGDVTVGIDELPAIPVDVTLRAYYSFDEIVVFEDTTSGSYDYSGNANHGIVTGSFVISSGGPSGNYVTSSDGILNMNTLANSNSLSGSWSFSVWFNVDSSLYAFSYLLSVTDIDGINWHLQPYYNTNTFRLIRTTSEPITTNFDDTHNEGVVDNNLHHFVFVSKPGQVADYYIDGTKFSFDVTATSLDMSGSTYIRINQHYGGLAELRFYDKELSENEVRGLYLNPGGNKTTLTTGDQISAGKIKSNNWNNFDVGSLINLNDGTMMLGGSGSNASLYHDGVDLYLSGSLINDSAIVGGEIQSSNWDNNTIGSLIDLDYGTMMLGGSGSNASLYYDGDNLFIDGTINVGGGVNIMYAPYADFDLSSAPGFDNISAEASASLDSTEHYFGDKSLKISDANEDYLFLGTTSTDYNINLTPGKKWLVSFYAKGNDNTEVRAHLKMANTTIYPASTSDRESISAVWNRYSFVVDLTLNTDTNGELAIYIRNDVSAYDLYIDGIMIEAIPDTDTVPDPSPFSLPGVTKIDGNQITTGEIRSANWAASVGSLINLDTIYRF